MSTTTWTALGPAPITNGQSPGNQPVSGRIAAVAADPTDPNTDYIAAAGGGVWKTTDGGSSWTPLTDSQATLSMGAIAVAPTDPNRIYAGTGEANFSIDSNYGRGILVSSDGGSTWTLTGASSFDRKAIAKIVVDPTDANTAYAAVSRATNGVSGFGIYKTTDGGTTWTNMSPPSTTATSFTAVAIDPNTPSTLYAAAGEIFGNGSNGVYKTTDGGTSWTLLSALPSGSVDGRISVAVAPSSPSTIYASIAGNLGSTGSGLFKFERSDDGGASWTDLTAGTPNYMGGQGWYDQTLIVSPTDSANVFAAGVGTTGGVVESTTGGVSWTGIGVGNDGNGPHTDHHGIAFDASNRLLDGNDGGIWRLDNATFGSIQWADLNDSINTIQFQGIGLHPTNGDIAFGGSQDNGTAQFQDSLAWTLREGGDGGFVKFSRQNPSRIYHVAPVGSFGGGSFFRRSDNGGLTWISKTSGLNNGSGTQFYPPFVVDPNNGDHLLLGANVLYETTSAGDSWTQISTVGVNGWNPAGNSVRAIGLAPSDSNNTIYASAGNNIFVTTDHGASWTQRNLPISGPVNDIQVDPNDPQIAYAVISSFTSGGNVFRTTNGGATWTNISGNLPSLPTWTLQSDPNSGALYVGNDDGVYVSTNLGTSWSRLGSNFPHVQVLQLDLEPNLNILGAATHGRGLWEILTSAQATTVTTVASTTPDGTYGAGATITITVGFSGPVTVTGTPLLGLNSGGTATYSSGSGTNTLTFTYVVGAGENSPLLDYTSTTALALNGGTINDGSGNPADPTLPPPGAPGSISATSNIVISTTTTVTNVASTTADGTYGAGATITITVGFSGPVTVTGAPQLGLNSGGTATYSSGSGTNTLTFTYVVGAGENSPLLDYTSTTALALNGGTINDGSGNPADPTLPPPGAPGSISATSNLVIDTGAPTIMKNRVLLRRHRRAP